MLGHVMESYMRYWPKTVLRLSRQKSNSSWFFSGWKKNRKHDKEILSFTETVWNIEGSAVPDFSVKMQPCMCHVSGSRLWEQKCLIDRFHCHATKKEIGNRPVEEAKKMKCYKRLMYKQFAHVSGLCGPQFLSYLLKRFTQLCRALYGDAILVHRFGAPIWPPEINKNIWSSLFL